MSENMLHIVVRDTEVTPEAQAAAFEFFESIVPESEYAEMQEDQTITTDDNEEITVTLDIYALEPRGASTHWQFDEETEEDESIYYGVVLQPETQKQLEKIIGAPVEVIWERM